MAQIVRNTTNSILAEANSLFGRGGDDDLLRNGQRADLIDASNRNDTVNYKYFLAEAQLDTIIAAIIDGKYSWACLLILKYVGLEPSCFIPYGTYNRLIKENGKTGSKRAALERQYHKNNQSTKASLDLANRIEAALEKSKKITTSKSITKSSSFHQKKDKAIKVVNQCQCDKCKDSNDSKTKNLHTQINLFLSRLNEQQRRWYVALEAKKIGHGGIKLMSQITGMHSDTIRRGIKELDDCLIDRPSDRIRKIGGGRKKTIQ